MTPKRQLIVNQVSRLENDSHKRHRSKKSDFKPIKTSINWNEVGEHIRKLPKPGDHNESLKPCHYCSQSKTFKVKQLVKDTHGFQLLSAISGQVEVTSWRHIYDSQ